MPAVKVIGPLLDEQAPVTHRPLFRRKIISFIRASLGDTKGTVSMVLAMAISNRAVKVM